VADEVSTGELARRLDSIDRHLRDLAGKAVSIDLYNTEQRAWERRFGEMEGDIRDLRARLDERDKSSGANIRQAIYAGLIPTVLFLVTILLQLKGGK
jgi:hypothetical protein